MPLVNGSDVLRFAQEGRFAVGAFNGDNMEMVQAIVRAADEERAPVIVQVSPQTVAYAGLAVIATMVHAVADEVDIPVVLHLDHSKTLAQNVACLREGFTSLMVDGSGLPFEENVALTAQVAATGHAVGVPVEGELGRVLRKGATATEVAAALTDPVQASDYVQRTDCDALAIAVGSVHAMTGQEAELDVERVRAVAARVSVPLVLHGSSGVKEDSIRAAIECGICKVNVSTVLRQVFVGQIRETIAEHPDEIDYRALFAPARDSVKERVREKLRAFGASGRITSSGQFRTLRTRWPSAAPR
ncbi:MAG: class II fructose-bisphosphate aldolase [Anaerolineales bacterium]|nr:class II fructose-bisphosphate aldolase [Anaerolineales bacterium]